MIKFSIFFLQIINLELMLFWQQDGYFYILLRKLIKMDILDQLNTQQSAKSKKKTSILSFSQSLPYSSPIQTPVASQFQVQKENIFVPRNDQHGSYQHLKNIHFDIPKANRVSNASESHKDALSVSEKMKKYVIPESLGVIVSESSQESQNSVHGTVSRPNRKRDNTISNKTSQGLSPIQQEQLKDRLAASESRNTEHTLNLKQLTKQLTEKQERIKKLQEKIDRLEDRNRQDRRKIIEQQSEIMKTQMQKIGKTHAQQIQRTQKLLKWEYDNKNNGLQQQINSLKMINQRYQKLFSSEAELSKYKNIIDQNKEKQNQEEQANKHNLMVKQRQVDLKFKNLEKLKEQFYKQKLQNDRKNIKIQNELNEERLKIKKQRMEMINQHKIKEQQLQQEVRQKIQGLEAKTRKYQLQMQQLQMIRAMVQKEKQQAKKLSELTVSEHKKNMQSLMEEKQRVYMKQKQLIEKIQIVEARNKNFNRPVATIFQAQNEKHTAISGAKKENSISFLNQKQNSMCSLGKTQAKNINDHENTLDFINKKYVPRANNSASEAKRGKKGIYKLQQFYQ